MTFFIIILSGISGTAFMTLFLYILASILHRQVKVVKILGTMLTNQTTPYGGLSELPVVIWVGMASHYFVGIFFAFCYYFLWDWGIGVPTLTSGMLFGLVTGCIGITVWGIFFQLHPHPPETVSLKIYLPALVVAHIIFGGFVNVTYSVLLLI